MRTGPHAEEPAHAQTRSRAPDAGPGTCTNRRLRQLTRQVSRFYDAYMTECGLTTGQYSLLAMLARLGPIRCGELARNLSMDPSTLTRNLQPLENRGWVANDPGPDARTRLLSLTVHGRAKCAEAGACWKRAQRAFDQTLGADRVARLHRMIDACHAALEGPKAIGAEP